MTALSHALIGAAISAKSGDPLIAGTLALITHLVCDAIPHWDLGTNWRLRPKVVTGSLAILETVVALVGTFALFSRIISPSLLLITIICSLLPDWLEVPYYLLMPHSPRLFYYIYKIQSRLHSRLQAPQGIWTQVAVVGLFLWVGFVI
jgi:hypothetical protein